MMTATRARNVAMAAGLWSGSAIGYLGFCHRGSLGDDAIFASLAANSAPSTLRPLPSSERSLSLSMILRRGAPLRGAMLGGGTLVGRPGWHERFSSVTEILRPQAWVTVGVGVEDPRSGLEDSQRIDQELVLWGKTLAQFRHVSVRGPRSADLLNRVGVAAVISGDPALALASSIEYVPHSQRPPSIVVAVSTVARGSRTMWDGSLLDQLRTSLRRAATDGFRLTMLSFNTRDDEPLRRIAAQVGVGNPSFLAGHADLHATIRSIASARLVIAERLHAGILAAACGTPFVSYCYDPKWRDFLDQFAIPPMAQVSRGQESEWHDLVSSRAWQADLSGMSQALRSRSLEVGDALISEMRGVFPGAHRVG